MGDTNHHEQNIKRIREALGNPDGCEVSCIKNIQNIYIYIIKPQKSREKVHISAINFIDNKTHLFQTFNLCFENCVFESEILLKDTKICNRLRFYECSFEKVVDFSSSIFRYNISFEEVIFSESTSFSRTIFKEDVDFKASEFRNGAIFFETSFEQQALFFRTVFNERVTFGNSNFLKNADFSFSALKKTLPGAIFKQEVCFDGANFHGDANFDCVKFHSKSIFDAVHFNTEAVFSGSIFKETSNFNKTIFDGYARFDNVNFNGMANFFNTQFKSGAVFSEAHFNYKTNRGYSAIFKAAKFSGYTWFKKAIFCSDANFEAAIFEKDVLFNNAVFSKLAYFPSVGFYGLARFSDVIFHKSIFGGSRFKERAFFSKAHFQGDAFLSNVIFEHNAYFDEVEFLGEAKFKQSEFYMNAHFYGTIFKEIPQRDNITMNDIPNFLQIILNGYINLTNTKQLLLSFEQLKSIIDGDNDKEKDELGNEFRNTFRNFKNGLIKDNNLIDASQFHKMELYAKELEINYKKEKAAKDWAEKIQLLFYRFTSDHHTDLLLILNNVIFLIISFGFVIYCLFYCADYSAVCIDTPYCFLKEKYLISPTLLEYICPNCTLSNIFYWEVSTIIATFFIFVVLFMLASWIFYCINTKCKYLGFCFVILCIPTLIILAIKPALILPIFGKLIDESLKIDFPAFTSLSIVYAILMFLLIFSLQKTARKNTIVPN